jgi:two-component system, LytTR family, response regulator
MIKAILVDDERLALDKLSKLLERSSLVEVAGTYEDPIDALAAVTNGSFDVAFLDIDMPCMNGLVLADKIMQINSGVTVVFVTAYNEYAIEAFELNALDYLLKPVRGERLQKTLERLMKQPRASYERSIVQVLCFGGFSVFTEPDGGSEIKWRTSKAEELFAFMIHHAGKPVSRNEIIDNLWEDLFPEKAVTYFHTTMYYVRKALSNLGIEGLIQHNNGFYKVDIDKIRCDYYEFERLLKITISPIVDDGIHFLENVASMYGGEYLRERIYPWAEHMRMSLEQNYVDVLMQLCDFYLGLKKFPSAIEVLRQALKYHPSNERIHEQLIRFYLLMNDRITAMKQYDFLRRELKAVYGVEPGYGVKSLLGVK